MLKRSTKRRSDNTESEVSDTQSRITTVAGIERKKDTAKKPKTSTLEDLVLGVGKDDFGKKKEETVLENLDFDYEEEEEKKPVWVDEDDLIGSVEVTKDKRLKGLRQGEECRIRTDQYTTRLKSQFEKISSTPNWAKLKSARSVKDPGSDDDSDVKELLQKTGNYIAASSSLPKGLIDIKQCPDANKESPSQGRLKCVEFHPSAQVILTAGMNQTLSLFQVDGKNNPKIQSVFLKNYPIYSAHFTCDGREVVMGSQHKSFHYYDMIAGKIITVPKIKALEENNMKRFVVSPDGKFLVFWGSYGFIHLLSAKSKEWISSLKMNGSVESVAFSPDSGTMYSHGDDGQVYIWDMTTRDCVHHFYDDGCVKGTVVSASPNGRYLACGSDSGVVNIYETESCRSSESPKPLKAVMNLTTANTHAIFNSASEILAISSESQERAVKLLHLPSLSVFSNFPDTQDTKLRIPTCLSFSPNNGYFSVSTTKGTALLYRVKHYGNY